MGESYAAFCCALTLAHLARCADAILRRAASESGFLTIVAGPFADCGLRAFAHRAFWASDILRLAAAETKRCDPGRRDPLLRDPTDPFSDSITDIAWSNFSTCAWAMPRSARSCSSALVRFVMSSPLLENNGPYCRGSRPLAPAPVADSTAALRLSQSPPTAPLHLCSGGPGVREEGWRSYPRRLAPRSPHRRLCACR
jgi:hypothetical protein